MFNRDTIYLEKHVRFLKNFRYIPVKKQTNTYRGLYNILKDLLGGRDEKFVGILVKGYRVTPEIGRNTSSSSFMAVSDGMNFNNE